MSARSLPEYSSIMASCTMVSSRWVEGLSTGILAFSARMAMKKAAAASSREGSTMSRPVEATCSDMPPRAVVPVTRAMANMDRSMVGSTMEEMNISLLEPMPPKVEPASRAASAVKNLTIASR